MSWKSMQVAPCGTHHLDSAGHAAYAARFDSVLKFHTPGLAPVALDGNAWHIDTSGRAAYSERFRRTFGYYEDRSAVEDDGGAFHIMCDGTRAYQASHEWCGNFQQGRCAVRTKGGGYRHIDPDGAPAGQHDWAYAGDFFEGFAVVQDDSGLSTHVDRAGAPTHGKWFLDLDRFHKGFARARDADGWMHVGSDGAPAYRRRFRAVEPFYNGQARVELHDGALEVIDEGGETLVALRPALSSPFASLSRDMTGFWRTQAIGAAVGCGLVEALPGSLEDIAKKCGIPPRHASRLLRALGEMQLAAHENGRWQTTERGEHLRRDHEMTLADAALEYAGPFSHDWAQLPEALRSPSQAKGKQKDVFQTVSLDEERVAGHHRMLRSYARHDYSEIVGRLELGGAKRIVDAGGGVGILAQLIAENCPDARVSVIERPEVVKLGQAEHPALHWQASDLFETWGLEADVVLLSRVLHDWDDAKCARILANARAALQPGGQIKIIEMLFDDDRFEGALCDLHLWMATGGGRERSASQYERMLTSAGFGFAGARPLTSLTSAIEGVAI